MIVKVLKLQVEDSAEGRVSSSFINKLYDSGFFFSETNFLSLDFSC
jgi:hypothetical protein